jgi:glyceraldehyde 3-phosphate dehydrogenase
VHPLLNHQKVLDGSCIGSDDRDVACNFEFGRSSTQNIIPSRTTTLNACNFVLPKIDYNNISSNSFRVPTATVGAIDVSLALKKNCTKDQLIADFKEFERDQKFKVLLNNNEPLVSSDFEKQHFTTIIDHRFTDVKKEKLVKLNIWYDNEWGYASKVVDIVSYCIDN